MVGIINVQTVGAANGSAAPSRRSPSLDAQLATTRNQLEDWVTCASAKTPEGKAKIEQISAKFQSIKSQIAKTDANLARQDDRGTVAAVSLSSAAIPPAPIDLRSARFATRALGTAIDTWA